jgi:hypothetical protein
MVVVIGDKIACAMEKAGLLFHFLLPLLALKIWLGIQIK